MAHVTLESAVAQWVEVPGSRPLPMFLGLISGVPGSATARYIARTCTGSTAAEPVSLFTPGSSSGSMGLHSSVGSPLSRRGGGAKKNTGAGADEALVAAEVGSSGN